MFRHAKLGGTAEAFCPCPNGIFILLGQGLFDLQTRVEKITGCATSRRKGRFPTQLHRVVQKIYANNTPVHTAEREDYNDKTDV